MVRAPGQTSTCLAFSPDKAPGIRFVRDGLHPHVTKSSGMILNVLQQGPEGGSLRDETNKVGRDCSR